MPSLNWIGKEAVTNHDKEVPFRLLKKIKTASVGDESQNLIIHGDNLEGLKALMPHYYGKVKCVYIDPPYNTGNENWVYNDKVNSPKIKQWLGKVVGRDAEDLTRHDKWLCMMYPRLKLMKDLLADDGAIFISIDDNEHCNLKQIMDEIFGEQNFITSLIWHKKLTGGYDSKYFNVQHEYVIVFARDKSKLKINFDRDLKTKYTLQDKNGRYFKWDSLWTRGLTYSNTLDYAIKAPDNTLVYPIGEKGKAFWLWSQQKVASERDELKFEKNKKGEWRIYKKVYASEELVPGTLLKKEIVGGNSNATTEIKDFFNTKAFEYAKPVSLIKYLIKKISNSDNDIILDSFAGSGTTGHAVLDLNKEDGCNRKFIMIEMEDGVAKDVTAERVRRAIRKYNYKDGFEYCELDKPLFDETGHIEKTCDFIQFATYIYFTETQRNIDKKDMDGNFIGEDVNIEFYLIYKEPKINDLDKSFIKKLRKTEGKKVVYADRCMLDDETLTQYNIVFKQIPYEVKIY